MKQDIELLAIARIRKQLKTLSPSQRLNVLRYVTEGEFSAQQDARPWENTYSEGRGRLPAPEVQENLDAVRVRAAVRRVMNDEFAIPTAN